MKAAALAASLLCACPSFALDTTPDGLLRDHLWRTLQSLPVGARPKVGVVLSAGSLRATSHVGVLSVLDDAGFPVDVVAGTSMGAIIGSLYAGGLSPKRLKEMSRQGGMSLSAGSDFSAPRLLSLVLFDSLLSSKKLESFLTYHIGDKRFDEMPKPFACVAMDLYSGEPIIFREGEVAPAVRASMSLPGFFSAVEYRHRYLVDGGVVDYIPVDAARLLGAEWVLASITESDYMRTRPRNVLETLEQVFDIRGAFLSRQQRSLADFLVEPAVGDIGMNQTERLQEAISKGSLAAYQKLDRAVESLVLFSLPRLSTSWGAKR